MRAPIHSTKHQVQYPFNAIATGTINNTTLIQAVESTVANTAFEIAEGSLVKAVHVELWLINASTDGHEIVTICKDTKNGAGPTFAQMSTLFTYVNKKNIFFTHEGLSASDNGSGPIPVINDWIKIPKGKQRFGLGDTLNLTISNPSSTALNMCGVTIYKEYS